MATHEYRVISLDVWGHGPDEHEKYDCDGNCDGYTVNDAFYCRQNIEVPTIEKAYNVGKPGEFKQEESTDADIIKALIDSDYLTADYSPATIEIDGESDGLLYLNRKEDGKPLLQLERIPE